MNIRLYATLLKHQDSQIEYKKLIVMVDTSLRVSMLKRKIEQEFTELFPAEKPFICSKLEDQFGYSLSNSSLVGELLKNDDKIVAVPEEQGKGFVSSTDTRELLLMLSTLQENISGKLADSSISTFNPIKDLLLSILPLCFVSNPTTMHNACVALSKSLHEGNFSVLETSENADLIALLVNCLHFLIYEYMERDTVVQRSVLDILEVATKSKNFANVFKSGNVLNKLMSSSRSMNQNNKARMIRVISSINRGNESWQDEIFDNSKKPGNDLNKNKRNEESERIDIRENRARKGEGDQSEKNSRNSAKREYPNQSSGVGGMVVDFLLMLSPSNTQEMICFALHSLENFVGEAVDVAMQDSELFSKCFNLIEMSPPHNFTSIQQNLLQTLGSRLIQARAEELVNKNGLTRLLKAYTSQIEKLQPALLSLFEQVLRLGKRVLDIPPLISICLCPYPSINTLAMKTLESLAEPPDPANFGGAQVVDAQFENHIRFFITSCTNEKQSNEYRNAAAGCLANLSLREYLRPQIIYCGGVDCLLYMVKDDSRVECQRSAAKALVNLTATKRDLKMKVVAELSEEIKKLYRNELDGIVSAYLQTLVSSR